MVLKGFDFDHEQSWCILFLYVIKINPLWAIMYSLSFDSHALTHSASCQFFQISQNIHKLSHTQKKSFLLCAILNYYSTSFIFLDNLLQLTFIIYIVITDTVAVYSYSGHGGLRYTQQYTDCPSGRERTLFAGPLDGHYLYNNKL